MNSPHKRGVASAALALLLSLTAAQGSASAQSVFPGAGFTIDMLDREIVVEPRLPMANPAKRKRLREALAKGGHAIVCRHGATDWLANDINDAAPEQDRQNRSVQRNLSPLGRAQAGAIRDVLDHLKVAIGPVYATFLLRTQDFAELATGRKAEVKDELLGIKHKAIAQWWSVVARSSGLPTTMFISAHGQPLGAMKVPIGEGECAIIHSEGEKRMTVLAVMTPSEWRQLLVP